LNKAHKEDMSYNLSFSSDDEDEVVFKDITSPKDSMARNIHLDDISISDISDDE